MRCRCKRCEITENTSVVTRRKTYRIHGIPVAANVCIRICDDCGEEVDDEELEAEALAKAKRIYKKKCRGGR